MKRIIFLELCLLFLAMTFQSDNSPGWFQQYMPNIGTRNITDICFLDSLTGYAVTNNLSGSDTGYILKTTNGGDIWNKIFTTSRRFTAVEFININTGYACGGSGGGTTYLCKTTNAGINWFSVNCPSAALWMDMAVLNNDTLWLVDNDGLTGGVFRTTNGGQSWTQQLHLGSQNPTKIYFYNKDLGFISKTAGTGYTRRTTDGGFNWTPISSGVGGFDDILFVDTLTGWKTSLQKTTDGGLTWVNQQLPQGGILLNDGIWEFSKISRDTIMGVGGGVRYPNLQYRGIIFKTTNGGNNWIYQIPDTSINIYKYYHVNFVSGLIGWAFFTQPSIHTTTGGDPNWVTDIKQISAITPYKYMLYQNYPNPFNPVTKIKYQIMKTGIITLKIFNIQGKEISTLISEKQSAGIYEFDFSGNGISSGVYFYSMFADGRLIDTKKMIFLK